MISKITHTYHLKMLSDKEKEMRLRQLVNEGRPGSISINGMRIYVSKKKINDIKRQEKEGGILPFLIPLFAGIGAAGAVAGGTAGVVSAVNTKAAEDVKLKQQREHNARVEAALKGNGLFLPEYEKGNGFSEGVKAFAEKTGLDVIGKKLLRTALKPLSDKLNVIVKGNGLILIPKTVNETVKTQYNVDDENNSFKGNRDDVK